LFCFLITSSCEEKTYYSGKLYNANIDFNSLNNKDEILYRLGKPNFIDIIENKYYYFNEKTVEKNAFKKEILSRNIIVYSFENNKVINLETYNLEDENQIKNFKKTTDNDLVEKGLIEKIFGGVSASQLPNTSN
tara:strand:- start:170 stop:571 length:402 start_codon:yes stop_codon:yes gene_type:complete